PDSRPSTGEAARSAPLGGRGVFEVATLALLTIRSAGPGIDARTGIARRFVKGRGLEIGALQNPLALPPEAQVRYVDRLPVSDLRRHYPELDGQPLVEPSVLASAEDLSVVQTGSEDFVACNHVLEHMRNPLRALQEWLRVLRPGGHLYVSIPDRSNPHDRLRDLTPFGH